MTNNDGTSALTLVNGGRKESATAQQERQRHERFLAKQADKRKAEAKAQQARDRIAARRAGIDPGLPRLHLDTDPDAIRTITAAINNNVLPDTYVRAGKVVAVETPSGNAVDADSPPQVVIELDPKRLNRLLAQHTYTYELRTQRLPGGDSETVEVEASAKETVAGSALAQTAWPTLRPLHGIITAPIFRPDGSLMQDAGYDPATCLIYAPKLDIPQVRDTPTRDELRAARHFLLDQLLHDFPFVKQCRANFVALLVAPMMRTYLSTLVPLGAIDATSPSTGKTLLTQIMTSIYSGYTKAWVNDDVELRKAITSILLDEGGAVVVLDNVKKGDTVEQVSLTSLLTNRVWSDRFLGANLNVKVANSRVWIVTGNALSIGGDMLSRTILVQLDTGLPDPDLRPTSKFALGDLEEWLKKADNRAVLLHHLLVLMRGWIVAGAPRIETPMRTFSEWASASAGFLDWLKEPGFMTNRADLMEADEEDITHGAFYARWHDLFGDQPQTAAALVDSATPDHSGMTKRDWGCNFLVRKRDGQVPSAFGLGKMLGAERGRARGGFRLDRKWDGHAKAWVYWVAPVVRPDDEVAS